MKKHSLKIAIKAENTLARERIEKARKMWERLDARESKFEKAEKDGAISLEEYNRIIS